MSDNKNESQKTELNDENTKLLQKLKNYKENSSKYLLYSKFKTIIINKFENQTNPITAESLADLLAKTFESLENKEKLKDCIEGLLSGIDTEQYKQKIKDILAPKSENKKNLLNDMLNVFAKHKNLLSTPSEFTKKCSEKLSEAKISSTNDAEILALMALNQSTKEQMPDTFIARDESVEAALAFVLSLHQVKENLKENETKIFNLLTGVNHIVPLQVRVTNDAVTLLVIDSTNQEKAGIVKHLENMERLFSGTNNPVTLEYFANLDSWQKDGLSCGAFSLLYLKAMNKMTADEIIKVQNVEVKNIDKSTFQSLPNISKSLIKYSQTTGDLDALLQDQSPSAIKLQHSEKAKTFSDFSAQNLGKTISIKNDAVQTANDGIFVRNDKYLAEISEKVQNNNGFAEKSRKLLDFTYYRQNVLGVSNIDLTKYDNNQKLVFLLTYIDTHNKKRFEIFNKYEDKSVEVIIKEVLWKNNEFKKDTKRILNEVQQTKEMPKNASLKEQIIRGFIEEAQTKAMDAVTKGLATTEEYKSLSEEIQQKIQKKALEVLVTKGKEELNKFLTNIRYVDQETITQYPDLSINFCAAEITSEIKICVAKLNALKEKGSDDQKFADNLLKLATDKPELLALTLENVYLFDFDDKTNKLHIATKNNFYANTVRTGIANGSFTLKDLIVAKYFVDFEELHKGFTNMPEKLKMLMIEEIYTLEKNERNIPDYLKWLQGSGLPKDAIALAEDHIGIVTEEDIDLAGLIGNENGDLSELLATKYKNFLSFVDNEKMRDDFLESLSNIAKESDDHKFKINLLEFMLNNVKHPNMPDFITALSDEDISGNFSKILIALSPKQRESFFNAFSSENGVALSNVINNAEKLIAKGELLKALEPIIGKTHPSSTVQVQAVTQHQGVSVTTQVS